MYENNVTRIEELTKQQNVWRMNTLNLIASENVLSLRARSIMGSDFAHRYAEGHPGERYYQGTDIIDEIEARLKKHLKSLFRCRQVDVRSDQPDLEWLASAIFYIKPGDVVMVNSAEAAGISATIRPGRSENILRISSFSSAADGYRYGC